MDRKSLNTLLIHELNDLYSAEMQVTQILPKMAEAAAGSDLRQTLGSHLRQMRRQVERLQRIFEKLGVSPAGKTGNDTEELIEDGYLAIAEAIDEDLEVLSKVVFFER